MKHRDLLKIKRLIAEHGLSYRRKVRTISEDERTLIEEVAHCHMNQIGPAISSSVGKSHEALCRWPLLQAFHRRSNELTEGENHLHYVYRIEVTY